MAQFEGATKKWMFVINLGLLRKIKKILSIDLLTDEGQRTAMTGIVEFVDVLGVVCEESIKAFSMTAEDFVYELSGPAYKAAHDAFFGELADFFPGIGRPDLGVSLKRLMEIVTKEMEIRAAKIEAADLTPMIRAMNAVDLTGELERRLEALPTTGK